MTMRNSVLFAPAFALALASCGGDQGSSTTPTTSATQPTTTQAPTDRDQWQAAGEVFTAMGGVGGKTVADLFAGDGYMTFKLIDAGANVIAIDTDPKALEAIEARKKAAGLGDDRLRTRLTTAGEPGITMEEADAALCMHKWMEIQDRATFFSKMRAGLKKPKLVGIVEFMPEPTPVGPPIEQRVTPDEVMSGLEQPGFTDVTGLTKKIPYQFIVIGQDYDPGPMSASDTVPLPVQ